MPIWTYAENGSKSASTHGSARVDLSTTCEYCASPMALLAGSPLPAFACKGMNESLGSLLGCPACGWWSVSSLVAAAPLETYDGGFAELRRVSGVLKNLDLTDVSTPTEELRAYLLARYPDRFDVHPKKYEDIVGGVFADFGYRVRVTAFSGDEGIDVFVLDGNNNATVGIQVKRHKGKISAEQIRAFVGALLLQGLTRGVYVTTSSFEAGAQRTATAAGKRLGVGVTLLDARRFYEALKISGRATFWNADDSSSPYFQCWQDVRDYLIAPSNPRASTATAWIGKTERVWGSSW